MIVALHVLELETEMLALRLARADGAADVRCLADAQALGARVAAALKLQVKALSTAA